MQQAAPAKLAGAATTLRRSRLTRRATRNQSPQEVGFEDLGS